MLFSFIDTHSLLMAAKAYSGACSLFPNQFITFLGVGSVLPCLVVRPGVMTGNNRPQGYRKKTNVITLKDLLVTIYI